MTAMSEMMSNPKNKTRKFWNFTEDEQQGRVLRLEGAIAEESWIDDEITPKQFKSELNVREWRYYCIYQ